MNNMQSVCYFHGKFSVVNPQFHSSWQLSYTKLSSVEDPGRVVCARNYHACVVHVSTLITEGSAPHSK